MGGARMRWSMHVMVGAHMRWVEHARDGWSVVVINGECT